MTRAASRYERVRELYRRERDSVARHLSALTGDPTQVEDLVNETFIRAFGALDSFDGQSSISTWLHGIAINVARNHLAKRRRRARVDEGPAASGRLAVGEEPTTPEDELARRRAIERFYAALDLLEPRLREVFVLRVIEQLSLKEVAAVLDLPLSTAHARAQRAEQRVRAMIEGES